MAMNDNLLAIPTDLYRRAMAHGVGRRRIRGARSGDARTIASVASATVEDGLAAVDAAQRALPGLGSESAARARRDIAQSLRTHDCARRGAREAHHQENGKALKDSRGEVAYAAEFFRWYSEEAVRNIGQNLGGAVERSGFWSCSKPVGVSVLVTPWNFPAAMATRKIGPALAAGCTVILKPASETPLTVLARCRSGRGRRARRRGQCHSVALARPKWWARSSMIRACANVVHGLDQSGPQASARSC